MISRSLGIYKKVGSLFKKPVSGYNLQSSRNSGGLFSYRTAPYLPTKKQEFAGKSMMGLMWWWVLWHLWHEPGEVFPGFWPHYPDPSDWTNEELGVPPDDA